MSEDKHDSLPAVEPNVGPSAVADATEPTSDQPTVQHEGASIGGEPWRLQTWVKGGTPTSRFESLIAEAHADADARRSELDADREAVRRDGAQMYSHQFSDSMDPRVLLAYDDPRWGGSGYQLAELLRDDVTGDNLLILVCLDCVSRGIPQDLAQLRVSDRHRNWFIDTRDRGALGTYVDAFGRAQVYVKAGKIMDTDILKCSQYNCTFSVRIHNNRIYRV